VGSVPLPTKNNANAEKNEETYLSVLGFEKTIHFCERLKTAHIIDNMVTVTGVV
jgi:hypothetical protein